MLQPVTPPPTITTCARLGTAPPGFTGSPVLTGSTVTSASKPVLTWRYA
jgi:hypothetical protein